jgi:predicted nucleotidyltransferase
MSRGWLELCLYPKVKLGIIRHFVQNPELRQNQTHLSRSIRSPQNSVSRHVSDLVNLRVLNEERQGKAAVYSLNKNSLLVKGLLQKMMALERGILPAWLKKQLRILPAARRNAVEEIVLFGSAARGELTTTSDIDLLAIVSKSNPDLDLELNAVLVAGGDDVGLKINLQIETRAQHGSGKERRYLKNARSEGIVLWKKGGG